MQSGDGPVPIQVCKNGNKQRKAAPLREYNGLQVDVVKHAVTPGYHLNQS